MTEKLVELARYENPFQAETVRIALVEHGVTAFVENSEVNRAMHYVGTALGSVKVLVAEKDKPRAKELLAEFASSNVLMAPPWICGACGEEVEGGFDECWSCGAMRTLDAQPGVPPVVASSAMPRMTEPSSEGSQEEESGPITLTANRLSHEEINGMLKRAWMASVIGFFLCPFGLHLYSAYLFICAREALGDCPDYSPPESLKRNCRIAKWLNCLVIFAAVAFMLYWAFAPKAEPNYYPY